SWPRSKAGSTAWRRAETRSATFSPGLSTGHWSRQRRPLLHPGSGAAASRFGTDTRSRRIQSPTEPSILKSQVKGFSLMLSAEPARYPGMRTDGRSTGVWIGGRGNSRDGRIAVGPARVVRVHRDRWRLPALPERIVGHRTDQPVDLAGSTQPGLDRPRGGGRGDRKSVV